MAILRCRVIVNEAGVKQFVGFALEDDKKAILLNDNVVAFNVFPNGDKVDMRSNPPFVQILPCPHCGSNNERTHDPLHHVNPKLGLPIEQVEQVAKEKGITTAQAHKWLLERNR